jgi:hypothetical protein
MLVVRVVGPRVPVTEHGLGHGLVLPPHPERRPLDLLDGKRHGALA